MVSSLPCFQEGPHEAWTIKMVYSLSPWLSQGFPMQCQQIWMPDILLAQQAWHCHWPIARILHPWAMPALSVSGGLCDAPFSLPPCLTCFNACMHSFALQSLSHKTRWPGGLSLSSWWPCISLPWPSCVCVCVCVCVCARVCVCVFFGCTCNMRKFPGQGLNPCHSSDLSHCSDNDRPLTWCTTQEFPACIHLMADLMRGPFTL